MNIKIVIWLLFAHWVADFVCQSDWMAQNKSKSNLALLIHCAVYMLIILSCSMLFNMNGLFLPMLKFSMLVGLIHFPVDYITSRLNSKLWVEKRVNWFFVSVGFDQWLHFVTLLVAYKYLVE